jgi:hypothetical protein
MNQYSTFKLLLCLTLMQVSAGCTPDSSTGGVLTLDTYEEVRFTVDTTQYEWLTLRNDVISTPSQEAVLSGPNTLRSPVARMQLIDNQNIHLREFAVVFPGLLQQGSIPISAQRFYDHFKVGNRYLNGPSDSTVTIRFRTSANGPLYSTRDTQTVSNFRVIERVFGITESDGRPTVKVRIQFQGLAYASSDTVTVSGTAILRFKQN